jgi:hypothetical protein
LKYVQYCTYTRVGGNQSGQKKMRLFSKTFFKPLRLGRLLAYAIGEIVLIVIGILIAFQLSTWSETRKAKDIELETLKDIKAAFESDRGDLDLNVRLYNSVITSCDTIVALLDNKLLYKQKMNRHFSRAYMGVVFLNNVGPYETLKSRGLETISNDTIRNKVIRIYEYDYKFLLKIESQLLDYVSAVEKDFYPLNFDQTALPIYTESRSNRDMLPQDFEKSIGNRDYIHRIRTIAKKTNSILEMCYIPTKRATEDLLIDLDKEIKRLE